MVSMVLIVAAVASLSIATLSLDRDPGRSPGYLQVRPRVEISA